ncbi:MAG: hypothetical protein ACSLFK_00535 [Gemmatimonadaceae bacterium]
MRAFRIEPRRLLLFLSAPLAIGACEQAAGPDQPPSGATILVAASPVTQSATVGSVITELPSVITQDSDGNPAAGITVYFRLVNIVGRITGNTVISNSAGIAQLGSWTLDAVPGANVVEASTGGSTILFTAHGITGPPVTLRKIREYQEILHPGEVTQAVPRVVVSDRFGNPVSGVPVTFDIARGNGSIDGATVATLNDGTASPGNWKVNGLGYHTLTASAPLLDPVAFTTLVIEDSNPSCGESLELVPGLTLEAELGRQGCSTPSGRAFDTYEFEVKTGQGALVTVTSAAFDSYLELFTHDGMPVGKNNDAGSTTNSAIRAFVPPGSYIAAASSAVPASGSYQISSVPVALASLSCDITYVVPGVVIAGEMTPCLQSLMLHRYRIYVKQGSNLAVTLGDRSYSDWSVALLDPSDRQVASSVPSHSYIYSLNYFATASGYYTITVFSGEERSEYTLSVK